MAETAPVEDLGHRLRRSSGPAMWPTLSESGTSCGAPARSPTPSAAGASGCRPVTTTSPPSRTTSTTSVRSRSSSSRSRSTSPKTTVLPYGLPPISADPPVHTWSRQLILPWFSHRRVEDYEAADPGAVPGILDDHRRRVTWMRRPTTPSRSPSASSPTSSASTPNWPTPSPVGYRRPRVRRRHGATGPRHR